MSIEGIIPDEIREEPDAIRATVDAVEPDVRLIAAEWRRLDNAGA